MYTLNKCKSNKQKTNIALKLVRTVVADTTSDLKKEIEWGRKSLFQTLPDSFYFTDTRINLVILMKRQYSLDKMQYSVTDSLIFTSDFFYYVSIKSVAVILI